MTKTKENFYPEGSKGHEALKTQFDEAAEALEEQNSRKLYKLFTKSVQNRKELIAVLHIIAEDKNTPFVQDNNVIKSMELVALAAINLAKDIALQKTKS